MNTKSLSRHYRKLTPEERVALLISATDRGDGDDADQLAASAPSIVLELPNYHGLADGWMLLSMYHMMDKLDLALLFFRYLSLATACEPLHEDLEEPAIEDESETSLGDPDDLAAADEGESLSEPQHDLTRADECDGFPDDPDDRAHRTRLSDICGMAGYRLCIESDAWRLVCKKQHIDPEALLRDLRGYQTTRQAEETARMMLWSPKKAAGYLKKLGREDVVLPTVRGVAKRMQRFIRRRAGWWRGL